MKKRRLQIVIAGSIVLSVLWVLAVISQAGKFDEHSLHTVHIQRVEEDGSLSASREVSQPLTNEEKALLSKTLASRIHVNELAIKAVQRYSFTIENRWGRSQHYSVFFSDNQRVFLQEQQKQGKGTVSYELIEPDFFYQHYGFNQIYQDRLQPEIQLLFNNRVVACRLRESVWEYLRFDNRWVLSSNKERSGLDHEAVQGNDAEVSVNLQEDILAVSADKLPDTARLQIIEKDSGRIVFDDVVTLERLPFPDMNGEYEYNLAMQWNDPDVPYRGFITVGFSVNFDLPEVFVFSNDQLLQGDMLQVTVYNVDTLEDLQFDQSLYSQFRWYEDNGVARGYIPTNYDTKPGEYIIRYGNKQTGVERIQPIHVLGHEYHIQHLTIDEKIEQSTRNDEAYAEFAKYFTPVRKQSYPQRYYTESFMIPTHGRLTTEFGQTRYVNGSPTASRHSGLDIAAPQGTEIVATNRGKVVLSMPLILTGNTIVIDHGEGLFSVYYHMHELFAEADEIVERGQVIGTVGTTGFSTGPHLHFMISHYDMNLEPGFFLVGTPITFMNYRDFLQ